jgi:hypothetical protein
VTSIASGNRTDESLLSPTPPKNTVPDTMEAEFHTTDEDITKDEHSEMWELHKLCSSIITSLFKLSMVIRKSTSRDRYTKAALASLKEPFDDRFDVAHVGEKFRHLEQPEMQWFKLRLGRAITQRRQYFRYCHEHRARLSSDTRPGLRLENHQQSTTKSTGVSGLEPEKAAPSQTTKPLTVTDASTFAVERFTLAPPRRDIPDDERSTTSYATSMAEDSNEQKLRVIQLSSITVNGMPFECPYCCMVQSTKKERSWV